MLALLTPCEPPKHSIWHVITGVVTLMMGLAIAVLVGPWLLR